MSNVVNWKKIAGFAAGLFFAEVLVGFIEGGMAGDGSLAAAKRHFALSTLLSLSFSAAISLVMAIRQYRPFLHAGLALLLTFAFSVALGAILPAWLTDTPPILAVIEWITMIAGVVVGTSAGRFVSARLHPRGPG
jgi:hypothetical protein